MKRISILSLTFLATWLMAGASISRAEVSSPAISDTRWEQLPAHPRLFANEARVAALKLQDDEVSKNLLGLLKNSAENHLTADRIVYPEGRTFKFDAVRNAQGRILTLALGYRIFGDERYLIRAKAELLQLAELPDWCPSHFIDVGEASLAAGIGLDWLYDSLTEAERTKVSDSIVRNALEPSLLFKEEEVGELTGNFNHNPVNNGGLIVGALAVAERHPQLARKVVERAIKFLPIAVGPYAPDGSYPEGPTYWSYGTTFHVIAVEALRSVLDTSCGLEKLPGLLESIDFMAQMVGPTGHDYNFGDATAAPFTEVTNRFTSEPVVFWFAKEKGRREVAALEIRSLAKAMSLVTSGALKVDQKKLSRHLAFQVLWWNPGLPPLDPTHEPPLHWTAAGLMPIAVMRSKWNDPMASYVAIKGGTPNNSHGQMDVGSFILEADGIRWALDMGGESYHKMRAAKLDLWNYTQDSDRWTTFRPGPDGHNIIRFNHARQDITGMGQIRRLPDENGTGGDIADLTSLYRSQVDQVTRTVKLLPNHSIVIQDNWKTSSRNAEASFQWLTKAKITRVANGVLLEHKDKSLRVNVEVPGSTAMPEISVEDVSKARGPQDSDNPGVSRFVIRLATAPNSSSGWKITAIPGSVSDGE